MSSEASARSGPHGRGPPPPGRRARPRRRPARPPGRAGPRRALLAIEDARADPRVRDRPALAGGQARGHLGVPVPGRARGRGRPVRLRPEPRRWTEHEVELVSTLSDSAWTSASRRPTSAPSTGTWTRTSCSGTRGSWPSSATRRRPSAPTSPPSTPACTRTTAIGPARRSRRPCAAWATTRRSSASSTRAVRSGGSPPGAACSRAPLPQRAPRAPARPRARRVARQGAVGRVRGRAGHRVRGAPPPRGRDG